MSWSSLELKLDVLLQVSVNASSESGHCSNKALDFKGYHGCVDAERGCRLSGTSSTVAYEVLCNSLFWFLRFHNSSLVNQQQWRRWR